MPGQDRAKTQISKSKSSDNPNRKSPKINGGTARDKSTIDMIKLRRGKPRRNKDGEIIGQGSLLTRDHAGGKKIEGGTGRVAPDRRWFGNTRTIQPQELDKFRDEMRAVSADPYAVVLRRRKLPMGLLQEAEQSAAAIGSANLLEVESFEETFNGRRGARKRPKLSGAAAGGYAGLVAAASAAGEAYTTTGISSDAQATINQQWEAPTAVSHDLFAKGQSKRIWAELYKVLDCSDVVIMVLDARDVPGTRCAHVERHLAKGASHKHLIFVINKCDLVPNWVTRKWVKQLSAHHPTLAFHSSLSNAFGKGALINLLRQFAKLHTDRKQISVGVIGFPNVGKSSVINTLRAKKVCKAAPVPGETKVWQYITLMRRIYLIDCPGVVYNEGDDECATVLKGVVRAERLPQPDDFVPEILRRCKPEHLKRVYGCEAGADDPDEFIRQLANKTGRMLRGAEPDRNTLAIQMINDWQRGKLPHFVAPPREADAKAEEESDGDEDDEPAGEAVKELQQEVEEEADGDELVSDNDEEVVDDDEGVDDDDDDDEDDEEEQQQQKGKGGKSHAAAELATLDWDDL